MANSWPERSGQAQPISVVTQAAHIAQQLDTWGKPRGAVTAVLPTIQQLWIEILENAATGLPRLLVCWVGETAVGGADHSNKMHRVTRNWLVVVLRGKGFAAQDEPGKQLDGSEGEVAFQTVCETVRDLIRVILSISEENPITYVSMKPLPNPAGTNVKSMFMDGMAIEFATKNDLQAVQVNAP